MAMIEINWKPDRGQLRGFGVIALVAFAALGAWIYLRQSVFGFDLSVSTAHTTAYVLWCVAALSAMLAAVVPRALWPLYVLLALIGLPIGLAISLVVMAILFYGVIMPIGLAFRLIGRDPLCRRFEPTASSYWVRRQPAPPPGRYYRQF